MMHLDTTPPAAPAPPRLPSIRDMHELVTRHLPEQLVRLAPLEELARRGAEIVAEHAHLAEEVPVLVQLETRRRARFQRLQVIGSRTPAESTTLQRYSHA